MEQENIKTKICSNKKCKQYGIQQPIENFYKDKRSKLGLQSMCKICCSLSEKKTRQKYKNNSLLINNKKCSICGKNKNEDKFHKCSYKKFGIIDTCKECININNEINHRNDPRIRMLSSAKRRSIKKNLQFNLCLEDIIIPKFCPILGIPIMINKKGFMNNSPSLDRIDNSKGYIPGNIRIISWRANHLKSDISFYELEKMIKDYQNLLKIHQEETNILEINNA